jgi:hypothetical protein
VSVIDIHLFHKIALAIVYPSVQDDWYFSRMPEIADVNEHATLLSLGKGKGHPITGYQGPRVEV